MGTYGFHTIHGRAPAIAMGVKLVNPDLSVWMITGDGDSLAIGGNHFIHVLRRNLDINILLFNNGIYGLTKGQYSPTSVPGQVTKSTPLGVLDRPFHAGKLALGAGATYFARAIDTDPRSMTKQFVDAEQHRGTSLIEILQNCVIFNDKTHSAITDRATKDETQLHLVHGEKMIFGKEKDKGIVLDGLKLKVVTIGENGITEDDILVHDAHEPDSTLHSLIAEMAPPLFPVALGVIRQVSVPTYDQQVLSLKETAQAKAKINNMDELLRSGHTWQT
jgi:2-oxoglutarate ferredoxin oxidoreductase subunit beta